MGRKRYLKKKSLEEARKIFCDGLKEISCGTERLKVVDALGRILSETVVASYCSPGYHASAMDGYAVEASQTFGARDNNPLELEVGREAHVVDTGDPLPPGTNAVIMVEDVHYPKENFILIYRAFSPYENVRLMGEDIVSGEMLLPAGEVITPYDIGLCLAAGQTEVAVRRKPRVAIIPSGDELISPGAKPEVGQIIEFNSAVLGRMVLVRGGEPVVSPITPDRKESIKKALAEALAEADIIVLSAGSSAGRDDYTAEVIDGMGELLIHGVAVMPGKPTALGIVDGKPVIGLPGYPASAVISFDQFVLPLVDRLLGLEKGSTACEAILSRDLPSRPGHVEFIRGQAGRVKERIVFNPLSRGASLLSSFARANSVARIEEAVEGIERGGKIDITPLVPPEEIERSLLLVGSHDLCLEILRSELLIPPGRMNLLISTQGSLGGLLLLNEDFAHLATCHLLHPESGRYNRPYTDRYLLGRSVRLLHVAKREQGLILAAGNPKSIRSLDDLGREDVLFVNRQRGSGTRILLDHLMGERGLRPEDIRGYGREEITHLTVAASVSSGAADAGLGIRSAAVALNLDFLPLAEEVFDLVVPEEMLDSWMVARVIEAVGSPSFKKGLSALGGYDTSISGQFD